MQKKNQVQRMSIYSPTDKSSSEYENFLGVCTIIAPNKNIINDICAEITRPSQRPVQVHLLTTEGTDGNLDYSVHTLIITGADEYDQPLFEHFLNYLSCGANGRSDSRSGDELNHRRASEWWFENVSLQSGRDKVMYSDELPKVL